MVVAEAFMYRHHPQTLKAKELVDSGAIGSVRFVARHVQLPAERARATCGCGRSGAAAACGTSAATR